MVLLVFRQKIAMMNFVCPGGSNLIIIKILSTEDFSIGTILKDKN